MTEDEARQILAEEMNRLREPDQRKVTADQFKDSNYKSYVAAMIRAASQTK